MAEDVLVREFLYEDQIKFGRDVVSLLDKAKIPIAAAYWLCTYDRGYWRLEIVTPLADEIGRYEVSGKIHELVRQTSLESQANIDPGWLRVLKVQDDKYKTKLKAIRTSSPLINERLTRHVVGDDLADLYVYRFPATYSYTTNKQLARPRYRVVL